MTLTAWVHRDTFLDTLSRYGSGTVFKDDRTNLEPSIGPTVQVTITFAETNAVVELPKRDRRRRLRSR